MKTRLVECALALALLIVTTPCLAQDYDLVILNGRVMGPETKLDAVRNVEIKNGRVEVVTDNADCPAGKGALPSTGFPYVVGNGTAVVKESKVLEDVFPGQLIRKAVLD